MSTGRVNGEGLAESCALEQDLAHRWQSLPLTQTLPLIGGDNCRLLYAGRTGGPQGPDIRDAVLHFSGGRAGAPEERLSGDIEFHIRCSDWYAHRHHVDVRYNNVILHVVLVYDSAGPIVRQDGQIIPICSLNDLVPSIFQQPLWPCQFIIRSLDAPERAGLLQRAGQLRFEHKTNDLLAQLRVSQPRAPFSTYDVCLIPALVEALGYGRDRAFFRAVGMRLVGLASDVPEPLGRAAEPSPLDAGRLRISGKLVEQWRANGAWETIQQAIPVIDNLRAIFSDLSGARADILICNVVLPFAAAVAQMQQDDALLERVRELYLAFPGLSSNQVTRAMTKQLGLGSEPKNACQQQGLHYIHAQTCREKHCDTCIVVGREV